MKHQKLVLVVTALFTGLAQISCGTGGGQSRTDANAQTPSSTPPSVEVVKVTSQRLNVKVQLPGELWPYEVVAIYPKATGFVDWIGVDRGSTVHKGQVIARLVAPELEAQKAEAQAKLQGSESQRLEAEAKLSADESTYQKLKSAAQTPGVVAGNDLVVAQRAADADRARVKALSDNQNAALQALRSVQEIERYLRITAPFDGVVTERNVHPGALVGPAGGAAGSAPMLRIETLSHLRLVVPVPESYVAEILAGRKVDFTVPAFPGETFNAPIARISHSIDVKTRTMPVELDVRNNSGRLQPGTFSEVLWPVSRPQPTLFVPVTAVIRTTERTFVVRVQNGKAEWVDVTTGATENNLIEIFGNINKGDQVVARGTDELQPNTAVTPRELSAR